MLESSQDSCLRVLPHQQPSIRRGRSHLTSIWQNHNPPERCLVAPESLQRRARLQSCCRPYLSIPIHTHTATSYEDEEGGKEMIRGSARRIGLCRQLTNAISNTQTQKLLATELKRCVISPLSLSCSAVQCSVACAQPLDLDRVTRLLLFQYQRLTGLTTDCIGSKGNNSACRFQYSGLTCLSAALSDGSAAESLSDCIACSKPTGACDPALGMFGLQTCSDLTRVQRLADYEDMCTRQGLDWYMR